MFRHLAILPTLLFLSLSSPAEAANFTFSYGTPAQCGNFSLSWTGGTAPFELTLIPAFGRPQIIQIPSSSFSNGKGSYQAQLSLAQKQQFVATMSDSSGFASGGISDLLTVGSPPNGAQCNTTGPSVDFFYDTNSALVQCRTYTFSNYTEAVLPVTTTGVIPGGNSFVLNAPAGATSFDWTANVASGTSILFFMTDSHGHQGGSTQVDVVGLSNDASCLTGNYPSSVANAPSAAASASSTNLSTSSASSTSAVDSTNANHSSASGGTIAAAVVASILGLVIVAVLALLLFRRRRRRTRTGEDPDDNFYAFRPKRANQPVDLAHDSADVVPAPVVQPYPFYAASNASMRAPSTSHSNLLRPSTQYDAQPFPGDNSFTVTSGSQRDSQIDAGSVITESRAGDPIATMSSHGQSSSSGARSKAAMAGVSGYAAPARFILHTDAEEVIELPPQYSDFRPPASSVNISSVTTYPPPPPGLPSATLTPHTPAIPEILEQDDHSDSQNLQQPLAPGPPTPSSALTARP